MDFLTGDLELDLDDLARFLFFFLLRFSRDLDLLFLFFFPLVKELASGEGDLRPNRLLGDLERLPDQDRSLRRLLRDLDLNGDRDFDLERTDLDLERFFLLLAFGERDLLNGGDLDNLLPKRCLDRDLDLDRDRTGDFGDLDRLGRKLLFLVALLRLITFLTSYLGSSFCFLDLWFGNDLGEDCLEVELSKIICCLETIVTIKTYLGEICLISESLLFERLRRFSLVSLLLRNLRL